MSNQFSFLFGIEIELLVGSRSKTHKTWRSLASEMSMKLASAGLANHVNHGGDKSAENYQEWSIVQEVTVPSQPGKNLWGIELVSPIFDASTPWSTHLSLLFRTLRSSFTLSASSNTSTHIHVSTMPALSPEYLGALSKAILYFEPAIDSLLPVARTSSYWCQSNHDSAILKSLPLDQCFEYLDYCGDATNIARTMCSFPARSAYGRANGYTEDFVHGVYKWDLSGLVDPSSCPTSNASPNGTLEFRQCPGSANADDARTWLMLALSFVAGAIDGGGSLDPGAQATMEDLWWTISSGIQSLGFSGGEARLMEKLFSGGRRLKSGRK